MPHVHANPGPTAPNSFPVPQGELGALNFEDILLGLVQADAGNSLGTDSGNSAALDLISTEFVGLPSSQGGVARRAGVVFNSLKPKLENDPTQIDPRLLQLTGIIVDRPENSNEQESLRPVPNYPELPVLLDAPLANSALLMPKPAPDVVLPQPAPVPEEAAPPIDLVKFEVHKFEIVIEPVPPAVVVDPKPQSKPRPQPDLPVTMGFDARPQQQFAQRIIPVEQVYSVNMPDLPPPPPIARKVSMEVGEGDAQVKITIHERNGDLSVRFDAATEPLRRDLETAAGSLLQALQREQLHVSNFDFQNSFGSATDSENASDSQRRSQKFLKPAAFFADKDETFQAVQSLAVRNLK